MTHYLKAHGRFIPAYAGNGPSWKWWKSPWTVHPCVRGERFITGPAYRRWGGSSLRTRGTGGKQTVSFSEVRFIPAYAGNGSRALLRHRRVPVHPCVRGERSQIRDHLTAMGGSSLRTRGTVRAIVRPGACGRFIPAYAGNGPLTASNTRGRSVHPCVRGERCGPWITSDVFIGSSLRTRGTAGHLGRESTAARFIPAYAGNGGGGCSVAVNFPVHPCVRGERAHGAPGIRPFNGSSLRTRGTDQISRSDDDRARFIPAYAGNGLTNSDAVMVKAVHPCVRGERANVGRHGCCPAGSSLRTRGTGQNGIRDFPSIRFIPAYAGNGGGLIGAVPM